MRRLAQKLEDAGTDSELRRYCERILRVRSSGWTQGIFANFAAESMVPKGPEWGGGNWEIKTPINLKDIPQWALAGEVMPYMKTSEGTIPCIIADHIGVYLGAIRGRGNVIEVREDSLVKAFTGASGENMTNSLQAPLDKPLSSKLNGTTNGGLKGKSVTGTETLTGLLAGAAAGDEQAKAAEDFKKSLYGVDGSSSEEDEGTTKTKKIRIRIRDKPVAAATVDVNKIKEATKQLKLGEGLGAPIRTKSLSSGSQDLTLILAEPTPAPTASTANVTSSSVPVGADVFGLESMVAATTTVTQPASMATGMGVTAGPIPEDFFQNTISSLRVAASLPASGTFISRLDPNTQGVGANVPTTNKVNDVVEVGLPDGGVPPQASQQPAVPLQSIGLPDGGVPPQPQIQVAQTPVPSQPVDLSALAVPGSNFGVNAGKSSAHPTSPPAAVRPGQASSYKQCEIITCFKCITASR